MSLPVTVKAKELKNRTWKVFVSSGPGYLTTAEAYMFADAIREAARQCEYAERMSCDATCSQFEDHLPTCPTQQ